MVDGKLGFNDYRDSFYDEFGNRTNNYIIEKYYKNGNNEWVLEETIKTNAGSCFVVEEKPYFECNGSLLPLNADFESKSCGACYKVVGKDTTEYKRIIGNEYLCENKHLGLRLHRQDYSDGTCFYTLEDNRGQWRVDYGNHDLSKLIKVLERGIEIDERYIGALPHIEEQIGQTRKLIDDIKSYMNCMKCSQMHFKQDEFWDNENVCICGVDNYYIGYPDEANKETCEKWKE